MHTGFSTKIVTQIFTLIINSGHIVRTKKQEKINFIKKLKEGIVKCEENWFGYGTISDSSTSNGMQTRAHSRFSSCFK